MDREPPAHTAQGQIPSAKWGMFRRLHEYVSSFRSEPDMSFCAGYEWESRCPRTYIIDISRSSEAVRLACMAATGRAP